MTARSYTVRFMREMQPVQYEKAQAMVELTGSVEEGENIYGAAEAALDQAKAKVLTSLGIVTVKAPSVQAAAAQIQTEDKVEVKAVPVYSGPAQAAQEIRNPTPKTLALAEAMDVDWRNVNGTGKDGRVTMKDVKAAGELQVIPEDVTAAEIMAEGDPEGDILDMSDEVPEEAVAGTPEPTEIEISYDDLQRASSAASKKVGGKIIRALIASYDVSFLREVPAERRAELLAELNQHV